ncbi:hypothetical protein EVAR_97237_1 [Eumeta japonica]|uniref:Uncharacterized protein n=1 Tax=Eumeta variegata TaxID=151549 RepID=A0A4C1ZAC7_EUMVA|nr:hypothetical protein EVAR_97237_1 [Eumeta japonica]
MSTDEGQGEGQNEGQPSSSNNTQPLETQPVVNEETRTSNVRACDIPPEAKNGDDDDTDVPATFQKNPSIQGQKRSSFNSPYLQETLRGVRRVLHTTHASTCPYLICSLRGMCSARPCAVLRAAVCRFLSCSKNHVTHSTRGALRLDDTISTDVITTSIAQSTNNSSPVSTTATQTVSNRTISSRKRRAAEEKKQQAMLEGAYNLLKRTSEPADDALVVFGNHVANELRKYDSQTLPYVKKAILDILFQADTGQFPRRGYYTADYYSSPSSNSTVTINVPTPPSQSLLSTEPSETVRLVQSPLPSTPYPETTINSLENTDLECFDM